MIASQGKISLLSLACPKSFANDLRVLPTTKDLDDKIICLSELTGSIGDSIF